MKNTIIEKIRKQFYGISILPEISVIEKNEKRITFAKKI
jgi:hypothetical protein